MSEAAPGPKQMSTPRALWALSRPKGMLFVSILPMIGFAYAYWDHGCEDATLAQLTTADLDREFPALVFQEPTSTSFLLVHLSTHLGYHLGQINYHRRLLDL